ncbi:hypothetical protein L380_03039 [Enterobacter roggenkampii MGH 34]|nr:hypothetical protein L380_03039 [Enterobacter roggenkampii MGH 34]
MVRRLLQLYVGLGLYGLSTAMFIRSDLGVDPWDVFHLGVGIQLGMTIGTVIILTGAAVLRCCCCGSPCARCRAWAPSAT